jgi:hypothetical protein
MNSDGLIVYSDGMVSLPYSYKQFKSIPNHRGSMFVPINTKHLIDWESTGPLIKKMSLGIFNDNDITLHDSNSEIKNEEKNLRPRGLPDSHIVQVENIVEIDEGKNQRRHDRQRLYLRAEPPAELKQPERNQERKQEQKRPDPRPANGVIYSENALWDDIASIRCRDRDEGVMTINNIRLSRDICAMILDILNEIHLPLLRNCLRNVPVMDGIEESNYNDLLTHAICKGREFYSGIIRNPEIILYLCDQYYPIYTWLTQKARPV